MTELGPTLLAISEMGWRGTLYGAGVLAAMVFLWSAMSSVSLSRRPGNNRKAFLALAAIGAALAVPALLAIAGLIVDDLFHPQNLRNLILLNAIAVMCGLLMVAAIASLAALAEMKREANQENPTRGRRQAAGALVASLALVWVMFAAGEFYRESPSTPAALPLKEPAAGTVAKEDQRQKDFTDQKVQTPPEALVAKAEPKQPAAEMSSKTTDLRSTASKANSPALAANIPVNVLSNSGVKESSQDGAKGFTAGNFGWPSSSSPPAPSTSIASAGAGNSSATSSNSATKPSVNNQNPGKGLADFGKALGSFFPAPPEIKTAKDERLNFQFRPPDAAWTQADAKRFNRDATLAYVRKFPEMYIIIIAERPGAELNLDLDQLKEITHANILAAAPKAQQVLDRPEKVHGLEGARIETEATLAGSPLYQVRWLCTHNGFAYQVLVFGRQSDSAKISSTADRVLSGFSMLDTHLVCHAEGITQLPDYTSNDDGISLHLGDRGWQAWDRLPAMYPAAQFGGLLGRDAMLLVFPIHFLDLKPPLVPRLEAFLALAGCPDFSEPISRRTEMQLHGLSVTQCIFQHTNEHDQKVFHRLALVHNRDCDFCFVVSSTKSDELASEILQDVLSRAQFTVPAQISGQPFRSAEENQRYGKFYNFAGLHFVRTRETLASEPYFLTALKNAPDMAPALDNYVNICIQNGHNQPALEALDHYRAAWRNEPTLQLAHAWLLSKVNRAADALDEYQKAFSGEARNDDYFSAYVRLLDESGQRAAARAAIDKYLAAGDSPRVALAKARMLSQDGKHDEAIELLKARLAQSPGNAEIVYALIDALQRAERFPEAHDLVKQLLADGNDTADTIVLKGIIELQLKWYKEAKATFEEALRHSPEDTRIQDYLARVSGLLGEGANVEIKEPIPAVPLPDELQANQAPPLPAETLADAPAYYRAYTEAIEFQPKQVHRTSLYESVQIINETGASRFSTIEFEFDPLNEKIFVNNLEVFDEQGKPIAQGDVADYFVADMATNDIHTHRKALHVPVPGIRPGCRIEVCVTTADIVAPAELPYVSRFFTSVTPMARETVYVVTDPERVAASASPQLETKHAEHGLYWQVDAPPVFRMEPDADPWEVFVPYVRLVDKQTTWNSEAQEYWKSIHSLLAISPEIQKTADDLTRNAPDDAAKIAAILPYVQKAITYKAIEFGKRARVMNSAEKTLHNRYGDCKDHSLLLSQLLQAAQVPCQLALVQTSETVSEQTPSLDQFNHMIVCAHTADGDRFLDATDKQFDPKILVPFGLAGRTALLLDEASPRLVRIPDYQPNSDTLDVNRHVRVDEKGKIQMEEKLTFGGYYAGSMREYLKRIDPTKRKEHLQATFGGPAEVQIQSLSIEGMEEHGQPLVMTMKCESDHALHAGGSQLVGRLPAPWESALFAGEPVDRRVAPLWLQLPLVVTASISIEVPKGYDAAEAEKLATTQDTPFFKGELTSSVDHNELQLQSHVSRAVGHFPAAAYQDYLNNLDQVRQMFSPTLVFKHVEQ
ncbi:MAG TPA: tetratricopeptide repeat protein [Pirellulales bacterium]|jgi:tetratricopeptide (TPR) repeat protein/transglutaminase-like putative cysteine protease|nr:tetratricopeptide repeat protein [Pirellulales bacterium]